MVKAILQYDLSDPDDKTDYRITTKATDMYLCLWDISQQVFRPHRKHGYSHARLHELCESEEHGEAVSEAIGLLEEMFYEILSDRSVSLED